MATYRYFCPTCNKPQTRSLSPEDAKKEVLCRKCQTVMKRNKVDSFTTIKETIDNGIMLRKVEQIAGANEQIHEREFLDRQKKEKDTL